MKNRKILIETLLCATVILTCNVRQASAQTSCATAAEVAIGSTNSAPAQPEIWYKFSVSGQPLARYYAEYDEKGLGVSVDFFYGECDDLHGTGSRTGAIEDGVYYIRFKHWDSGSTPQAFEWSLNRSLVVPMTGIEVTPKSYNMAFGESFQNDIVFRINPLPANATETSFMPEYVFIDGEGIVDPQYLASNSTVTAVGSGTVKLAFVALDSDMRAFAADTATINIAAPALCSSATSISAGTNNAAAAQEQWFRFTPEKTGIYAVNFDDIDINGDGKGDLVTDWTVYKGECNGLRKVETAYLENAKLGFHAEAGQIYSIKLYQRDYYGYGFVAFDWTLTEPTSLTGFSLTTKTLELLLPATYDLRDLGLKFTPEDAIDKGVSVEVLDESLIEYWDDGQPDIYKDAIRTKDKEGSTYIVFTTHDGGLKDSCLVTVKQEHLTGFALSQHERTLWLPYSQSGEYVNINDTSALKVVFTPENATDKTYTATVRKKGVVTCDGYGIQAMREGSTYIVFTANDGGLQDSILVHVTRTVQGGSPCQSAAVAQLGANNMPAQEYYTKWFKFTPTESGSYGLTNHITKYPETLFEVYEGQCDNLYLLADGRAMNASSPHNGSYEVGFYGEAGKTYYLKLTTGFYNTVGGSEVYAYTWTIAKVSASISGKVTGTNNAPAQGKVELYSESTGKMIQTTIQPDGTYRFDNLTVGTYAVRAVTSGGDIAWYRNNTPYFTDNGIIDATGETTGIDIRVSPQSPLNEGEAIIKGYIVKSEDAALRSAPAIRRVLSADGHPASGVTVFLLRNEGSDPIAYTITGDDGYFEFTGVGAGDYRVRVQIIGMETETTEVSVSEDGQTVELAYEVSDTGVENTTTGIDELRITNDELRVYPNPVRDELRITNYELRDGETFRILDLSGRTVITAQGNTIRVSSLTPGIYFVKAGNQTAKFIKH
jgi:uncharacterized protein YjdB